MSSGNSTPGRSASLLEALTPVTLEGSRLRLEPMTRDHLPGLVEVGLDAAIWRWMYEVIDTPDKMKRWLETALEAAAAGSELPFASIELSTGRVVGSTRYLSIVPEHRRLEIGWTWLAPEWQRSGINREAKLLLMQHAFEELGCRRVEFKTDALNEGSRAALLGMGATFEGIFRRHMTMADGRLRDSAYYSVIDSEWPGVRRGLERRLGQS
ncbi:MAG: GNAT family N-acetyltransferase [Chloroflexi bacterium]|nr:GNAT family N-acetyltransferase [Chloroflexota bacterium]